MQSPEEELRNLYIDLVNSLTVLNKKLSTYDDDDGLLNLYVMLSGALHTLDEVLDRQPSEWGTPTK